MTKKIVMFFDERLDADFRVIRFKKSIPIRQELDNIYMFLNDRNLWTRCKKKMRENQSQALMVQKGFAYYNSKGLGQVPVEAVEEILGTKLNFEEVEEYA